MALLRRFELWASPLVLMAVIFALSAQPSLDSGLGLADEIGRKVVHFGEYLLLTFLWWRALRTRTDARRAALAALLVSLAYAASDEYHQSFVEGRSGSPADWVIDAAGAALASTWLGAAKRKRAPA